MSSHQNLQDVTEDQLSLASIHYMRSHYQEAIDIYKRILLDNRCASLNPIGALMLLVVFQFQVVAWFLKVGIFHNYYVLSHHRICTSCSSSILFIQSIMENPMFKKKSALCCFLLVQLIVNSFWYLFYFVTCFFWNYIWLCTCFVFLFFHLWRPILWPCLNYCLLLHLLAFLRRVQGFYVEFLAFL